MGKFIVEKWQCDRCGAVHDKRPHSGAMHEVRVMVDHGVSGGLVIDWKEMCQPCDRAVESIIKALKALHPGTIPADPQEPRP